MSFEEVGSSRCAAMDALITGLMKNRQAMLVAIAWHAISMIAILKPVLGPSIQISGSLSRYEDAKIWK